MLLTISLWLLVSILILWALLDPVSRVSRALYEIIIPIIMVKSVDLKNQFGEWAGKHIIKMLLFFFFLSSINFFNYYLSKYNIYLQVDKKFSMK